MAIWIFLAESGPPSVSSLPLGSHRAPHVQCVCVCVCVCEFVSFAFALGRRGDYSPQKFIAPFLWAFFQMTQDVLLAMCLQINLFSFFLS